MLTLTSKTGNKAVLTTTGFHADKRIANVVDADGMALVSCQSARAARELANDMDALGFSTDCDGRALKVW